MRQTMTLQLARERAPAARTAVDVPYMVGILVPFLCVWTSVLCTWSARTIVTLLLTVQQCCAGVYGRPKQRIFLKAAVSRV